MFQTQRLANLWPTTAGIKGMGHHVGPEIYMFAISIKIFNVSFSSQFEWKKYV